MISFLWECANPDSAASDFDNVITVNAFSKSYAMTGWKLGYATGPKEVLKGMLKIYQHSTTCVTAFVQYGAPDALIAKRPRKLLQKAHVATVPDVAFGKCGKVLLSILSQQAAGN
jgi:aspartate/methionine/tyrosine aminotransferase